MEHVTIIGIDLAKRSFQLHGARPDGSVAFRKRLSRDKVLDFMASQPRCVVAMEACGSSHHWGREVKLVPPIYGLCEASKRRTLSVSASAHGRNAAHHYRRGR